MACSASLSLIPLIVITMIHIYGTPPFESSRSYPFLITAAPLFPCILRLVSSLRLTITGGQVSLLWRL